MTKTLEEKNLWKGLFLVNCKPTTSLFLEQLSMAASRYKKTFFQNSIFLLKVSLAMSE